MAEIKRCKFCNVADIIWKQHLKSYVDVDDQNHKHRCDAMAEAFASNSKEELITFPNNKSSAQQYDDKVNMETTLSKILSVQYKILDEVRSIRIATVNRKPFNINFNEPLIKEVPTI